MKKRTMKMRLFAVMTAGLLTMGTIGGAVTALAASGTEKVKCNLNMRSGMTLKEDNVVLVIPRGRSVSIVSEEANNWYKVTYSGTTGYVKGGYFGEPASSTSTSTKSDGTTKTLYENLNMRSAMDKSTPDNIITVIGKGKSVTILNKESGGWYKVSYKGKTGYIMGGHFTDDTSRVGAADAEPSYAKKTTSATKNTTTATTKVKKAAAGEKITTNAYVNLRKEATSAKNNVITEVPSGQKLTVKEVSGNWYKVNYDGNTGYIYYKYASK